MSDLSKQEQMYVDIVQLVADIARDGFGIDVINNPLVSGTFRRQLEIHHNRLVNFITKYAPSEPITIPEIKRKSKPRVKQPIAVKKQEILPDTVEQTKQSELSSHQILGE